MPSENTQFKGKGLGTTNKQRSRGAKFPPEIDAILEQMKAEGESISDYIRDAVVEKMKRDGLLRRKDGHHRSRSTFAPVTAPTKGIE